MAQQTRTRSEALDAVNNSTVAVSRHTQCDHCGEVRNACRLEEWTDPEGRSHSVCHAEVDAYLAALREQAREDGRVSETEDGTLVV